MSWQNTVSADLHRYGQDHVQWRAMGRFHSNSTCLEHRLKFHDYYDGGLNNITIHCSRREAQSENMMDNCNMPNHGTLRLPNDDDIYNWRQPKIHIGAIQVLRNADGGGGCPIYRKNS